MASVSHPHDMRPPQSATPAAQYEPSPRSSAPPAAKSNSLWLLTFGAAAALTAAGYIWRHELGIAVGGLLKMLGLASAPFYRFQNPRGRSSYASAFAPAIGRVRDEVLVQIFLHAPAGVSAAASLAHEADPTAVRRGIATLAIEASHGQRIDVILEAGAIPIDEASQSLVWRGEPCSCQFILTLPSDQAGRTYAIKAQILLAQSVLAGALRFSLKITADTPTSALDLVGEAAHRYRQAFLSHSHTDRVKVLTYAQLLDAIGIRYFQDVASLRAMEHWEHRLHEAIDGCDLFLLFWTADAAHSNGSSAKPDTRSNGNAGLPKRRRTLCPFSWRRTRRSHPNGSRAGISTASCGSRCAARRPRRKAAVLMPMILISSPV